MIEKSRKSKKCASIFSWRIPKESSFLGALSRKSSTQGTRSMVQKKFIVFSCYLKGAIFQGKPFNGWTEFWYRVDSGRWKRRWVTTLNLLLHVASTTTVLHCRSLDNNNGRTSSVSLYRPEWSDTFKHKGRKRPTTILNVELPLVHFHFRKTWCIWYIILEYKKVQIS